MIGAEPDGDSRAGVERLGSMWREDVACGARVQGHAVDERGAGEGSLPHQTDTGIGLLKRQVIGAHHYVDWCVVRRYLSRRGQSGIDRPDLRD